VQAMLPEGFLFHQFNITISSGPYQSSDRMLPGVKIAHRVIHLTYTYKWKCLKKRFVEISMTQDVISLAYMLAEEKAYPYMYKTFINVFD